MYNATFYSVQAATRDSLAEFDAMRNKEYYRSAGVILAPFLGGVRFGLLAVGEVMFLRRDCVRTRKRK